MMHSSLLRGGLVIIEVILYPMYLKAISISGFWHYLKESNKIMICGTPAHCIGKIMFRNQVIPIMVRVN